MFWNQESPPFTQITSLLTDSFALLLSDRGVTTSVGNKRSGIGEVEGIFRSSGRNCSSLRWYSGSLGILKTDTPSSSEIHRLDVPSTSSYHSLYYESKLLDLPRQRWPLKPGGQNSLFLNFVFHPLPGPWQTAPVHFPWKAVGPLALFTLVTQQLSLTQCFLDTLGLLWIWPTDFEMKGPAVCYQLLGPVHTPREDSKYILSIHRKISYYNLLCFLELKTYLWQLSPIKT